MAYDHDDGEELFVGDICIYMGEEVNAYTRMAPRLVYRVVSKEPNTGTAQWCRFSYGLQVAFDIAGHDDPGNTYMNLGARLLKRLDLVGLGLLRMELDRFISAQVVKWSS